MSKAEVGFGFDLSAWRSGLQRAGKMAELILADKTHSVVAKAAASATAGFAQGFEAGMKLGTMEDLGGRIGGAIKKGIGRALALQDVAAAAKARVDAQLATLSVDFDGWAGKGGDAVKWLALQVTSKLLSAFARSADGASKWGARVAAVFRGAGRVVGTLSALAYRAGRGILKGVEAGVNAARRALRGLRKGADFLFNGIFTVGSAVAGVVAKKSMDAFLKLQDAQLSLRAAVNSLNPVLRATFDPKRVEGMTQALNSLVGMSRAEATSAFGDFLTRGFSPKQAELYTVLAAGFAKKTGRSIEQVQRAIADAGQGSVDGLKALGVGVSVTGNKVVDANAAIQSLLSTYGTLGDSYANPFDRLQGNMDNLLVVLGEKLMPIFGPLVEKVNLFIQGLLNSEEGAEALKTVADSVKGFMESIMAAGGVVLKLWDLLKNLFFGIRDMILTTVFGLVEKVAGAIAWLAEKMGKTDLAASLRSFSKDMKDVSSSFADDAVKRADAFGEAWTKFTAGEDSSAEKFLDKMMEEGRRKDEADKAALTDIVKGSAQLGAREGFAGSIARRAEAERAAQQREAALKGMNTRMSGRADAQAGQRVSVRIVSTRPDRFRKARAR